MMKILKLADTRYKDNRQTQFECVQCGFTENADVVGVINMLKRGQVMLTAQ